MIDKIKKLPLHQRLLIGKTLLVLCIPIFILVIVLCNAWTSTLYFIDLVKADLKHEWNYFVEYLTMKDKVTK